MHEHKNFWDRNAGRYDRFMHKKKSWAARHGAEMRRSSMSVFSSILRTAYRLSGSRGDFTGVGDIHFFYSADEVLYGALPDFEEACKRANVPYTVSARPKMVHCYCMLPIFREAKEDFAKIVDILKK